MSTTSVAASLLDGDEIDLTAAWRMVLRQKVVVLVCAAVPLLAAAALVVTQPRTFVTEATILPVTKPGSKTLLTAAMANRTSPVSSVLGGYVPSATPDLVAFLKSHALVERVTRRCLPGSQSEQLKGMVKIFPTASAEGVTIRVEAPSETLALSIAGAYLDELKSGLDGIVHTAARKDGAWLEGILSSTRQRLEHEEGRLAGLAGAQDHPAIVERARTTLDVSALRSTYSALLQYRAAVTVSEDNQLSKFLQLDSPDTAQPMKKLNDLIILLVGSIMALTTGAIAALAGESFGHRSKVST